MYTTLNQIRNHEPCSEGWAKLLRYLNKTKPDDEPVSIATILESNGFDDALWCLRSLTGYEKEVRLLAVSFAREVQHLMIDPRSLAALEVAEAFANGQASQENLDAARLAAYVAAEEASSLSAVVGCASYTAYVAHAAASAGAATAAAYTAHEAREAAGGDAAAHAAAAYAAYAAAHAAAYTALEATEGEASLAAATAAAFTNSDACAVRVSAMAAAKDSQKTLLLKALTLKKP